MRFVTCRFYLAYQVAAGRAIFQQRLAFAEDSNINRGDMHRILPYS